MVDFAKSYRRPSDASGVTLQQDFFGEDHQSAFEVSKKTIRVSIAIVDAMAPLRKRILLPSNEVKLTRLPNPTSPKSIEICSTIGLALDLIVVVKIASTLLVVEAFRYLRQMLDSTVGYVRGIRQ